MDDDAAVEEARALLTFLLDHDPLERDWQAAIEGEILFQQHAVDEFLAGRAEWMFDGTLVDLGGQRRIMANLAQRILLLGTAQRTAIQMAEAMLPLHAAAEASTWPEAETVLVPHRQIIEEVENVAFGYNMAAVLLPSLDKALESHYLARNARHRAAVALAVALYRHDHDDALPPNLEALVPDYLPEVPADVMTAEAAVQYDAARGIAWTVGRDGVDHGGVSLDERVARNPHLTPREAQKLGYDEVVRLTRGG